MAKRIAESKSRAVYEKLRKMIIEGEFVEPHPWSLRTLAEEFGVSVAPVTEAVRRLEQEGILVASPQRGISVRHLTVTQLRQANVVREALEIQAARMLAKRADKRVLNRLRKTAETIRTRIEKSRLSDAAFLDFKLHRHIVEGCGNDLLAKTYDQVITACMLSAGEWNMRCFVNEDADAESHTALVDALCTGDPDLAEKAIRRHIRSDASG